MVVKRLEDVIGHWVRAAVPGVKVAVGCQAGVFVVVLVGKDAVVVGLYRGAE